MTNRWHPSRSVVPLLQALLVSRDHVLNVPLARALALEHAGEGLVLGGGGRLKLFADPGKMRALIS